MGPEKNLLLPIANTLVSSPSDLIKILIECYLLIDSVVHSYGSKKNVFFVLKRDISEARIFF